MTSPWAVHTACSDPGPYADLVHALPAGVEAACAAARNVIGHFGAEFGDLGPPERDDVDLRLLSRILEVDQRRHRLPLDVPRDPRTRVAGCCRDHALFVVGVLRERGIPARTRVGFADYLIHGRRVDHVIVEYLSAGRWIRVDPEIVQVTVALNPADLSSGPEAPFQTAAEAWQTCRQDPARFDRYQIPPGSGFVDPAHLIRTYVALELVHRCRQELLLWDTWAGLDDMDNELADQVAALLRAADSGDRSSENDLIALAARIGPQRTVIQLSPFGEPAQQIELPPV